MSELKYLDISEFQLDITDVKKLVSNCDGVMVRVGFTGYGSMSPTLDQRFDRFMEALIKEDIPVGVYYFTLGYNESIIDKEINFLFSQLKRYEDRGYRFKLPIAVDCEAQQNCIPWTNLTAERRSELMDYWCKKVKEAGYYPIIYAGVRGYHRTPYWLIKGMLTEWDKWTAQYYTVCQWDGVAGADYHIWQYASDGDGKAHGLASSRVDMNKSYVDYAKVITDGYYNHIEKPIIVTPDTNSTCNCANCNKSKLKVTIGNDIVVIDRDTKVTIECF